MLEIKPYSEWSATAESPDAKSQIKGYADYVRTSYAKEGQLTKDVHDNILAGAVDLLNEKQIISKDMPEEERNQALSETFAPRQNVDADAERVLGYLGHANSEINGVSDIRSDLLRRYLSAKKFNPAAVPELQEAVDGVLSDASLVAEARKASVNNGEYDVAAYTTDKGERRIYTNPELDPSLVRGQLDSYLAAGVIDPEDLVQVNQSLSLTNQGRTTVAKLQAFDEFSNMLEEKSKADPEFKSYLDEVINNKRTAQIRDQRSTSEKIGNSIWEVLSSPALSILDSIGDAAMGNKEKNKYANLDLATVLLGDDAVKKNFSEASLAQFSDAFTAQRVGAQYRSDKPETGYSEDSMGNPILATGIIANKQKFDATLAAVGITGERATELENLRTLRLDESAAGMKKLIVESDSDAASAYTAAKAAGKKDSQFVEEWLSDEKNYSGFSERAQQLGMSAVNAVGSTLLSIPALLGNKNATDTLGALASNMSKRQEYSRLFGDEYGVAAQAVFALPQVAVDIASVAAITMTGGLATPAVAAIKEAGSVAGRIAGRVAGRAASKVALRSVVRNAMAGEPAALAQAAVRSGATTEGFARVADAVAVKYSQVLPYASQFAVTMTRSSASSYVSVYSQLPDTMSHEEKHEKAFGFALASGMSEAVITTALGKLGMGGAESAGLKMFGVKDVGELTWRQSKFLYQAVENEGKAVTDGAFKRALAKSITGTYKNFANSVGKGFMDEAVEESLQEAIGNKIEDAALDRNTPMAQKVNQVFNAGLIGGLIGGGITAVSDAMPLNRSAKQEALQARVSVLDNIAKRLRESGSPETAETVQRRMDQANKALADETLKNAAITEQQAKLKSTAKKFTPANVANGEGVRAEDDRWVDFNGEEVTAHGYSGIVEVDADGNALLRFHKPLSTGETHIELGPSHQKVGEAISQGPDMYVLAEDEGKFPTGAMFVYRNNSRWVFPVQPDITEADLTRDRDGNVVAMTIRGAEHPTSGVKIDVRLSTPYRIRAAAKHYGIEEQIGNVARLKPDVKAKVSVPPLLKRVKIKDAKIPTQNETEETNTQSEAAGAAKAEVEATAAEAAAAKVNLRQAKAELKKAKTAASGATTKAAATKAAKAVKAAEAKAAAAEADTKEKEALAKAAKAALAKAAKAPAPAANQNLTGWGAQWALASVARSEKVDLTKMSREEYADYAISKGLEIDDTQLRMAQVLRSATSVEEYRKIRETQKATTPEEEQADMAFMQFADEMKELAVTSHQLLLGVKVNSGIAYSISWLAWKINQGANRDNNIPTHKAYVGFTNVFKSLTPERITTFLAHLQSKGFNGDLKTIQDLATQNSISDQIVMHGATEADAQLALAEAQTFFGDELNFTDMGFDLHGKSHSQRLAEYIKQGIAAAPAPAVTPAVTPAVAPDEDDDSNTPDGFEEQEDDSAAVKRVLQEMRVNLTEAPEYKRLMHAKNLANRLDEFPDKVLKKLGKLRDKLNAKFEENKGVLTVTEQTKFAKPLNDLAERISQVHELRYDALIEEAQAELAALQEADAERDAAENEKIEDDEDVVEPKAKHIQRVENRRLAVKLYKEIAEGVDSNIPFVEEGQLKLSIPQARKMLAEVENALLLVEDDQARGQYTARISELKAKITSAVQKRSRRIKNLLAEADSWVDVADFSDELAAKETGLLGDIEAFKNPAKKETRSRIKHPTGVVDTSTVRRNKFVYPEEKKLFNELVEAGIAVTDLQKYGEYNKDIYFLTGRLHMGKAVPLFSQIRLEDDPYDRRSYIKQKRKLLHELVLAKFPVIEYTARKNKVAFEQSTREYYTASNERTKIQLPVALNEKGVLLHGLFTNDLLTTTLQRELGFDVVIDKKTLARHNNEKDAFKINPSISHDPLTGVVTGTRDPVTGETRFDLGAFQTDNAGRDLTTSPKEAEANNMFYGVLVPDKKVRGYFLREAGHPAFYKDAPLAGKLKNEVQGYPLSAYLEGAQDHFIKAHSNGLSSAMWQMVYNPKRPVPVELARQATLDAWVAYYVHVREFAIAQQLYDAVAAKLKFENKGVPLTPEEVRAKINTNNLGSAHALILKTLGEAFDGSDVDIADAIKARFPKLSKSDNPRVVMAAYGVDLISRKIENKKTADEQVEDDENPRINMQTGLRAVNWFINKFGSMAARNRYHSKDLLGVDSLLSEGGGIGGIGEDNMDVLSQLMLTGSSGHMQLDPLSYSIDDEVGTQAYETYYSVLRDRLNTLVAEVPDLHQAMSDLLRLFGTSGGESMSAPELLNNLESGIRGGGSLGEARTRAVIGNLYKTEQGKRAAAILVQLGVIPPVSAYSGGKLVVSPSRVEALYDTASPPKRQWVSVEDAKKEAIRKLGMGLSENPTGEEYTSELSLGDILRLDIIEENPDIRAALEAAQAHRDKSMKLYREAAALKGVFGGEQNYDSVEALLGQHLSRALRDAVASGNITESDAFTEAHAHLKELDNESRGILSIPDLGATAPNGEVQKMQQEILSVVDDIAKQEKLSVGKVIGMALAYVQNTVSVKEEVKKLQEDIFKGFPTDHVLLDISAQNLRTARTSRTEDAQDELSITNTVANDMVALDLNPDTDADRRTYAELMVSLAAVDMLIDTKAKEQGEAVEVDERLAELRDLNTIARSLASPRTQGGSEERFSDEKPSRFTVAQPKVGDLKNLIQKLAAKVLPPRKIPKNEKQKAAQEKEQLVDRLAKAVGDTEYAELFHSVGVQLKAKFGEYDREKAFLSKEKAAQAKAAATLAAQEKAKEAAEAASVKKLSKKEQAARAAAAAKTLGEQRLAAYAVTQEPIKQRVAHLTEAANIYIEEYEDAESHFVSEFVDGVGVEDVNVGDVRKYNAALKKLAKSIAANRVALLENPDNTYAKSKLDEDTITKGVVLRKKVEGMKNHFDRKAVVAKEDAGVAFDQSQNEEAKAYLATLQARRTKVAEDVTPQLKRERYLTRKGLDEVGSFVRKEVAPLPKTKIPPPQPPPKYLYSKGVNAQEVATTRAANNADVAALGLRSGDIESVISALRKIAASRNTTLAPLAKMMLNNESLIRGINFSIIDIAGAPFAGTYLIDSNAVVLNLAQHNGRGLADVLVHEFLHAPTARALDNPMTPAEIALGKRVGTMRNLAIQRAAQMGMLDRKIVQDGLGSNHEFITTLLTSPEFASAMRMATPVGQRTFLERVIDFIKAVFGADATDVLLDQAMIETLDFTRASIVMPYSYKAADRAFAREQYFNSKRVQDVEDAAIEGEPDEEDEEASFLDDPEFRKELLAEDAENRAVLEAVGDAAEQSLLAREARSEEGAGISPAPEGELGDMTAFTQALDGVRTTGNEDRILFSLAVGGVSERTKKKIKSFGDKLKGNVPKDIKKLFDERQGADNRINYNLEVFKKDWEKLRDEAIASGATAEEIHAVLGTTMPILTKQQQSQVTTEVRAFAATIAPTVPPAERRQMLARKRSELTYPYYQLSANGFLAKQAQAEQRLRQLGNGKLVDKMVDFREQMNKDKRVINYDHSNDIYLTRSYRFFTTDGWSKFALTGGQHMIDGELVDFDALRAEAAKRFYDDVMDEHAFKVQLDANTVPLSQAEIAERTLDKLDEYLKDLVRRGDATRKTGGLDSLKRDLDRFRKKKDIDVELRGLLGEVVDPFENAVRTAYSVGKLAANSSFLEAFTKIAIDAGLASHTPTLDATEMFDAKDDPEMEPLAGLYVRNDIAAALRSEFGSKIAEFETHSDSLLTAGAVAVSRVAGFATGVKTYGSVGFYPRNVLTGLMQSLMQGIPPSSGIREIKLAWLANSPVMNDTTIEQREYIRRLIELNMLHDTAFSQTVSDLLRGFSESTDDALRRAMDDMIHAEQTNDTSKLSGKAKELWEGAKRAGVKTHEFLAAMNNVIDSAFKIHAFEYELKVLKEAYGDTKTQAWLEAEAAVKVKAVFPTHSQQFDIIKSFNKTPLSMAVFAFARYKSEVMRNVFNTIPLALSEIKTKNPVQIRRGVQRILSFSLAIGFGGSALAAIVNAIFQQLVGDDDEGKKNGEALTSDQIRVLKKGLPKWQRNHTLYAQLLANGDLNVINLSNILPHNMAVDLFKLTAKGDVEAGINYLAADVFGEQIAYAAVMEAKENRNSSGFEIYSEADTTSTKLRKVLTHLSSNMLVPSAVLKGMAITRDGEQQGKEMFVGELIGARPRVTPLTDVIKKAMRTAKQQQTDALDLRNALSGKRKLSQEDLDDAVINSQRAVNNARASLREVMHTAREMGIPDSTIYAMANKDAQFSKDTIAAADAGYSIGWFPNAAYFATLSRSVQEGKEEDGGERAKRIYDSVKQHTLPRYSIVNDDF